MSLYNMDIFVLSYYIRRIKQSRVKSLNFHIIRFTCVMCLCLCFKNVQIVVRRFEFTDKDLKDELLCKKEFPQVLCGLSNTLFDYMPRYQIYVAIW